jgi:hypothetical protein
VDRWFCHHRRFWWRWRKLIHRPLRIEEFSEFMSDDDNDDDIDFFFSIRTRGGSFVMKQKLYLARYTFSSWQLFQPMIYNTLRKSRTYTSSHFRQRAFCLGGIKVSNFSGTEEKRRSLHSTCEQIWW